MMTPICNQYQLLLTENTRIGSSIMDLNVDIGNGFTDGGYYTSKINESKNRGKVEDILTKNASWVDRSKMR